jgi:hypothetical protein
LFFVSALGFAFLEKVSFCSWFRFSRKVKKEKKVGKIKNKKEEEKVFGWKVQLKI